VLVFSFQLADHVHRLFYQSLVVDNVRKTTSVASAMILALMVHVALDDLCEEIQRRFSFLLAEQVPHAFNLDTVPAVVTLE